MDVNECVAQGTGLGSLEERQTANIEVVRLEIGKLAVKPGEMLVIRVDRDLPDAEVGGFMQALGQVVPRGVTAFLMGPGFSLEVVKADYDEVRRGLLQAAKGLGGG